MKINVLSMNKKVAVAIPSYKMRFNSTSRDILCNLNNFDKKYDVYVFLNENEERKEDYHKLAGDNVYIIDTPTKTIFEKRQYMLDYLYEKGYNGYFQIDDDVIFRAMRTTEELKRKNSDTYKYEYVDFNLLLDKCLSTAEEYDAAYVTTIYYGFIGFKRPNTVSINKNLNTAQFGYFDIDKIKEKGISYDTSGDINEDVDFTCKIFQHGLNSVKLCSWSCRINNSTNRGDGKSVVTPNIEDMYRLTFNTLMKYHGDLQLLKQTIQPKFHLEKLYNTFELPPIKDPELYEVMKTYDIDKVREYLIKKKTNHN